MADSTGAAMAALMLPSGATTATIESKTNFFRPVSGGSISATATVVHSGRSVITVQTDIENDEGALVSRTIQTQSIRPVDE